MTNTKTTYSKTKKARIDSWAGEVAVEQASSGATLEAQVGPATKGRQQTGLMRNAQIQCTSFRRLAQGATEKIRCGAEKNWGEAYLNTSDFVYPTRHGVQSVG